MSTIVDSEPNVDAYRECVDRVRDWFTSILDPCGMIREEPDLLPYYHSLGLLAATNRAGEAHRMADWIKSEAFAPDGDFRTNGAKGAIIQPQMMWNYMNGWLTWGLARLGRFDMSEPAARYLETFQDDTSGGFLTAADPERGFTPVPGAVDVGSTCAASLAMIYTGRWTAATRAAEFLMRVLDQQPQPREAFYTRFSTNGQAITEFPDEVATVSVIRFSQRTQAYWFLGFAARILALVHRATNRRDLLQAALRYVDVFNQCHEDRWEYFANDKMGWAAAALYQITRDPEHRLLAGRIFNPIVERQDADGTWHSKPFIDNYDEWPRALHIEINLELGFLAHEILCEVQSCPFAD